MKLVRARLSSFKSIVETTLNVDPRITLLVGPNEGGKTNILRAMESCNPEHTFSQEQVCQFSETYDKGEFAQVQLLFGDFTPADRKALVEVWTRAADTQPQPGMDKPEDQLEEEQSEEQEGGDVSTQEYAEQGQEPTVKQKQPPVMLSGTLIPSEFESLKKLTITRQGNELDDYYLHFDESETDIADEQVGREFKKEVIKLLPRFLYFEDINLLRGEFELDEVLSDDPAFETERNLFRVGGITNLEMLSGDVRRRDIALQNAEWKITERLKKYWTQDRSRKFHIDVDQSTLRVRISDATGVFAFPEERSLGSRWFMSFYINFVSRIEGHPENAILLFDEPAIHTHPRGQRDLLPFFEELGNRYQLLYTAHLPFLINRNFPARIRVVEKRGQEGTTINNKPHENRWKAIRSAVGLLAADSFLIGDTCLVVEGVSDHVYLAGLSHFVAELGCSHLDLNHVSIIPASSASETVAPARFCQAEKIPVVIFLDSDNQGRQAAQKLVEDRFINKSQIIQVNEALVPKDEQRRTTEDLLPANELLASVNSHYQPIVHGFRPCEPDEVTRASIGEDGKPIPIINAISKVLTDKNQVDLDKRAVAESFINRLPTISGLSEEKKQELRKAYKEIERLFLTVQKRLEKLAAEGVNEA